MPFKRWTLLGVGLALLAILFVGNLLARQLSVFSRDDLIVAAHQTYNISDDIDRSMAVFANDITLDADVDGYALLAAETIVINSSVENDLTAMAETITFDGQVAGDAVFMAEHVTLNGQINGEAVVLSTTLDVSNNFNGAILACVEKLPETTVTLLKCDHNATGGMVRRAGSQLASVGFVSLLNNPNAAQAFGVLLPLPVVLFLTGVAALLVTMLPRPIGTIEAAVRAIPGQMVITGGMIALMAVGITAAFILAAAYLPILALILSPFYLLGLLLFIALVISGWVTLAVLFGGWLARRISSRMFPPVVTTVMGGAALAVVAYAVSWLPGGDWIVIAGAAVLELAGLGAAYATRMGRRSLVGL
ncbi:MAG: hypothetical protein AAF787_03600 [Chloroflexota bacterium]